MEFIKNYFKLEERGTTFSTELVAGITTFLAMAYILPVNASMLSMTGIPEGGVFFATAVSAAIASLVMALLANLPVALAPGMGLNAFFTYTLVFDKGLTWAAALGAVLLSGVLFFIISVTGLRKRVINAIPRGLKFAVGAGIGFFITFIGLKNAGIIVIETHQFASGLPQVGDLTNPGVLLGVFGLLLVVVLFAMKNRFALIISIVVTGLIGVVLGLIGVDFMPAFDAEASMGDVWTGASETFGAAFGGVGELFNDPAQIMSVFGIIFTLLFVDFFDTAGTLMAVGNQAGLINEDGELIGSEKALLADSIGTMAGAVLGTSNVTSYIESATGIEQGARTGLSSAVVAILFVLSIFVYPLLSIVGAIYVPGMNGGLGGVVSPVTSMALVMVGALMVGQLKEIDFDDPAVYIPAFLTIVFMILSYSIATGIAIGFVFYPLVKIAQGKWKDVNGIMYGLMVLFIIFFIVGAA